MKNFSYSLCMCLLLFLYQSSLSQNVGIGTTNPVQKLHVEGTTYIRDSLGIGTATPVAAMDVNGTAIFRGNNSNTLAGGLRAGVEFFTGRNDLNSLPPGASLTDIAFNYAGPDGGFRHYLVSRHSNSALLGLNGVDFYINTSSVALGSFAPGIGNINAMSVTDAGVGIGTRSPAQKLHVVGNAYLNGKLSVGINPSSINSASAVLNVEGTALFKGGNTGALDGPQRAGVEFFFGRDGVNNVVPGGYPNADIAFNYGQTPGGFRHFIGTRHYAQVNSSGNAFDFYLNNSIDATASQQPGTGNKIGMSIAAKGTNIPNGYLAINTNQEAGERLYVNGDAKIETDLSVNSNISTGGNINATGNINTSGNINVTGTVNMGYTTQFLDYSLAPNNLVALTQTCPAGYRLLFGGGGHRDYTLGAADITVHYNGPDVNSPSTIWRLIASNTGTSSRLIRIYCACARIN